MIEKEKLVSMVCAVQNGDNDAMTELYDAFHNDIYYYILKTVKDSELAADLTQDAFLEIFQTIGSLKEPVAFVNWSKKIAYHRCTAYFRKKRDLLLDEDEEGQSVFDTIVEEREEFIPDEALDKEELKKTIHEMIDSLPEEQRTAIMMRYFDEMSVKEIADIQGVTEGTVKSRLNYGRKAIKGSVEEYEKKNGVKLRCAGVVPLLLWLFKEYRIANGMSLVGSVAKSSNFTKIALDTGINAGKKVMSALTKKIVAGVIAVSIVITGVVVGVTVRPEEPSLSSIDHNNKELTKNNVYGTSFGNMLVLSAHPIEEYNGDKPDVESLNFPNNTSRYEEVENITKIVIIEQLKPTSMNHWFSGFSMLENIEGLENIDTTRITDMKAMFSACKKLKHVGDLSAWNVSNVTSMHSMFMMCEELENIGGLSAWDVSNVTDMSGMFIGCRKLKSVGDLSAWNVSNVTSTNSMFSMCQELKTIGNLSKWDVGNVTDMKGMFLGCAELDGIGNLNTWDVSNVTDMNSLFVGCKNLENIGDINAWNVSNVANMEFAFQGCDSLNELPLWYH